MSCEIPLSPFFYSSFITFLSLLLLSISSFPSLLSISPVCPFGQQPFSSFTSYCSCTGFYEALFLCRSGDFAKASLASACMHLVCRSSSVRAVARLRETAKIYIYSIYSLYQWGRILSINWERKKRDPKEDKTCPTNLPCCQLVSYLMPAYTMPVRTYVQTWIQIIIITIPQLFFCPTAAS